MDRVTRSLITSTPKTQTHREALGEDGTLYTIETSWEEGYMDHQPRYNGSQWSEDDTSTNNREYIITTVKTSSLERKPLTNYQAFSATPSRVTKNYSTTDGVHRADLWVPSPDRDSKLELVRKGELYDLRAYKEERKPAKLYSESDEELEYHIVAVKASPDTLRELEDERKRIIEGQKVKLSPLRQWRSLDELGSEADSPPASPRKMPETSATEFERQFGTLDSRGASFNQENVDREQINFLAARQQFLMLEQRKPDLLQGLKPQSIPLKPSEPTGYVYERDWQREDRSPYAGTVTTQLSYHPGGSQRGDAGGYKASPVQSLEDEMVGQQRDGIAIEPKSGKIRTITRQLLVTPSREHLDSGNDEGFVAGYGSGESTSREVSGNWHVQDSDTEPPTRYETPIEKEIRLALEREEELRRERGIQGSASTQELVAIFKTPLLYRSPPSSPGRKSKERRRSTYFIQREIDMDTKREDDLISEGKLVGLYDKGLLEEVGERKKRFEQEDEVPVLPVKSIHYKSLDLDVYKRNSSFVPVEMQEQNQAQNVSPEGKRSSHEQVSRIPLESYAAYLSSDSEGSRAQSVPGSYTHSSRYTWHPSCDYDLQTPKQEGQAKADEQDSSLTPKNTVILQKEYFSWKPWTPKLSPVVTAQDPPNEQSPKLRPSEKALYQEQSFTAKPLRTHTSSLIEREIQEVLQREEELQQQRRMLSQRPSSSLSADHSGPWHEDSQQQDQVSGSPGRHVVSLFSTPFQPLVLNTTPASEQDLPGEPTYETYRPEPKGPASPPPEWEQGPASPPPECEPRTPGKLKHWQLEEFERGRSRDRDLHNISASSRDTRGVQSPGAVPGHRGSPDKHVVSLFVTPFRPLVFRTAPGSWDSAIREESTPPTYGVTPKVPTPPPLEWEPRTPGRLRDEQLEEFERRSRRQKDKYGESRGFESSGVATGHVSTPERYTFSLFSTPLRPLVLGTTPGASSDTPLRKEPTYQTYSATSNGSAPPPPEWETRTPYRLKDSQLEEFEDRRSRQRDEYGYAGIDPRDDVDNEIVESTRVSRRKSAMALRWEAGQYLNTQDDE